MRLLVLKSSTRALREFVDALRGVLDLDPLYGNNAIPLEAERFYRSYPEPRRRDAHRTE